MACQLTAESVGGVLHFNLARRRKKKKKKERNHMSNGGKTHCEEAHLFRKLTAFELVMHRAAINNKREMYFVENISLAINYFLQSKGSLRK